MVVVVEVVVVLVVGVVEGSLGDLVGAFGVGNVEVVRSFLLVGSGACSLGVVALVGMGVGRRLALVVRLVGVGVVLLGVMVWGDLGVGLGVVVV
jgi:hypothetical protein